MKTLFVYIRNFERLREIINKRKIAIRQQTKTENLLEGNNLEID